jgi:hypothetical protein
MQLQQKALMHEVPLVLLGITQAVLVFVLGPRPMGGGGTLMIIAIPLVIFAIYTGSRAVKPRHHRNLYAILTASIAAIMTIASTVGRAAFLSSTTWWTIGALLSAMPYFVAAFVEFSRRRRARSVEQ